ILWNVKAPVAVATLTAVPVVDVTSLAVKVPAPEPEVAKATPVVVVTLLRVKLPVEVVLEKPLPVDAEISPRVKFVAPVLTNVAALPVPPMVMAPNVTVDALWTLFQLMPLPLRPAVTVMVPKL